MEAFGGFPAVEALQKGADAVGQLSDEDLNALLGRKATVSPAEEADNADLARDGQESLIGVDSRARNNTTAFPTSAVVLIISDGVAAPVS
ncbi:MAG: hypothetical protein ACRBM6_00020 [Geminicoccales bacterium]